VPAGDLTIARVTDLTPEVRDLVSELDAELSAGYPPEQQHGLKLDELLAAQVRFYVARVAGAGVGCGAVALFEEFAEIKRMYTRPAGRGRGVARAILQRLESDARQSGVGWLRLETGDVLDAAMALYARHGFRPCNAFGDYLGKPAHAIARSRFFEKQI